MYNDKTVNYSGYYPNAGTYNENPTTLDEDFFKL